MDFGEISDIIVGAIAIGSAIYGIVIKPLVEQKRRHGNGGAGVPSRPSREQSPRKYAPGRPAPRRVPEAPVAEKAAFRPWTGAPSEAPAPMPVETAVPVLDPSLEGLRSTDAVGVDAEFEPVADERPAAAEILGSEPDDFRRGVIWAEILTPKF